MDPEIAPRSDAAARGRKAEAELAKLLEEAGWRVRPQPDRSGSHGPDMIMRRGRAAYAVEVKAAAEGRSDRLIPLWSQAYVQAVRAAGGEHPPLAVVAAPRIAPRAADQIMNFVAEFAPDAAAGVFDFAGLRRFRGPHLEGLDSDAGLHPRSGQSLHDSPSWWPAYGSPPGQSVRHSPADIFSDLNQWMLKVLLAPEIPPNLLSAPRHQYRDASHLARSAKVSAMSASRLVRQLQHEGYLDASKPYLSLVRRHELFRRWQASLDRPVKEVPMRFLLRGDPKVELRKILKKGHASLALFSAAEALRLGFVHGVPPYVYVPRLGPEVLAAWKNLVPAEAAEGPDVIVRQAPAAQSVFRGVVRANDVPVSDILQVWLDVSSHPSRGQEQADFIRRRVLAPIIDAGQDDG
jgi:hypothetical protein